MKIMGWDSEFFTHRKDVFGNQKEPSGRIAKEENKFRRCSGCNQPIGTISTTLYEIDEKHYCSECYFRTIVNQAVERDHSDIKREKEALKKPAT
jgi:hypothetical protein